MKLDALYQGKSPDISIELFPPKTPDGIDALWQQVERLCAFNPAFFSMTYGAAGSTRNLTLELVDHLKNRLGVEAMCHLTVVGQSQEETRATLDFLQAKGIYNLIALRGDPPRDHAHFTPHPDGFEYAVDLVTEAHQRNFFTIAVAGFPERHPDSPTLASDLHYLKKKVDAGACVIISQLFLDNAYFYAYHDAVRKAGISVPIIPGILPILSAAQVRRFTQLCKATIPPQVDSILHKYEQDDHAVLQYGIELATQQCEGLLQFGCPGLHFYSLNRSRSVEAVLKNLRLTDQTA